MDFDRHQLIGELFLNASRLAGEKRSAYLDEACAGDAELRAEVDSLLGHDATEVVEQAGAAIADGARELVEALPEAIGGYRILSKIGSGGMGVVYEAEQEEPSRRVALKVIKPGLTTESTLRRFRHEAQVLGWLDHPSIARIYEAGTDDYGLGPQPWFAMELIRGVPLTFYADQKELGVRERLELLAQVCDAVHHAHQKGVIHRDLKPGNVLVDESGRPRVLDFGVARVTDHDLKTTTLQTNFGELIGTLAYMSPEQVQADPSKLDVRSDVYALGVVAYELLSGRRPHDFEGQMIHVAARVIAEDEPSSLGSLDSRLRGDVETIVAKAVEKDKTRRYASAEELASDIRRHLAHQPIQARPPSAVYQLRKFARRNKALVGGLAGIFVALLAGVIVSTKLYLRSEERRIDAELAEKAAGAAQLEERRQKEQAQKNLERATLAEADAKAEAQRAEQEKEVAEAVTDYLVTLFEHANPDVASPEDLTARQILDQGAKRIQTELNDQPAVRARLLNVFGKIYNWLQLYDVSEPILVEALELTASLHGEDSPEYADTLERLAQVRLIAGDLDESEEMQRQVLDIRLRHLGPEHELTTDAMGNLAGSLMTMGEYEEAEELLVETVEIRREHFGERSLQVASGGANLAVLYSFLGRLDEAEELLLVSLEIFEEELGETHWRTLFTYSALADTYMQSSRSSEAIAMSRKAYEGYSSLFGFRSKATFVSATVLAASLIESGEPAEAVELLEEVLPAHEELYGRDDGGLNLLANLASAKHDLQEYEEAEAIYLEVSEERERDYGPTHPDTLTVQQNLAVLYFDTERLEEAEALHTSVFEGRIQRLGEAHRDTRTSMKNLALLYAEQGRLDDSEGMWRRRLTVVERELGPDDTWTLFARLELAQFLVEHLQRYDEAEELLLDVWAKRSPGNDEGGYYTRHVPPALVELYDGWGKPEEANPWREKDTGQPVEASSER